VFIDRTATPESSLDGALLRDLILWETNAPAAPPDDLAQRLVWLSGAYEQAVRELDALGIEAADLEAVLASGRVEGHAYARDDGTHAAWVDAGAIPTPVRARFAVLRALLHAAHYARNPKVAYRTPEESRQLGRRLWSEGVAAFLAGSIAQSDERDACWADVLGKDARNRWRLARAREEFARFRRARREWESTESDEWFVSDPDRPEISRIGAYTGYRMARFVRAVYLQKDADLLEVDPQEVRALRW